MLFEILYIVIVINRNVVGLYCMELKYFSLHGKKNTQHGITFQFNAVKNK